MSSKSVLLFLKYTLTNTYVVRRRTCEIGISRLYGRWVSRRPLRVFMPDEAKASNSNESKLNVERHSEVKSIEDTDNYSDDVIELSHEDIKYSARQERTNIVHRQTEDTTLSQIAQNNEEKEEVDSSPVEDKKMQKIKKSAQKLGVPVFFKDEANSATLSSMMIAAKSKKQRDKSNLILLEGKRLIKDAINTGHIPHSVFFSHVDDLKDLQLPFEGVNIYKVLYKTISLWSDVQTSSGVLAFLKMPDVGNKEPPPNYLPITVLCDNVRDPGNLGAILRVTAGAGCEQVLLSKGCVDLWEPKVLRTAAGSHFRMRIQQGITTDNIFKYISEECKFFLADNCSIGTDGSISDGSDSKEIKQKQTFKWSVSAEVLGENVSRASVPVLPYHEAQLPSSGMPVVLVLGGETEGISDYYYSLAHKRNGARLNIPLSNGVESLNTGSALSVILFEMRRKLISCISESDSDGDLLCNYQR